MKTKGTDMNLSKMEENSLALTSHLHLTYCIIIITFAFIVPNFILTEFLQTFNIHSKIIASVTDFYVQLIKTLSLKNVTDTGLAYILIISALYNSQATYCRFVANLYIFGRLLFLFTIIFENVQNRLP